MGCRFSRHFGLIGAWYANNLLDQPTPLIVRAGLLTDGNLASHLKTLKEIEIITGEKGFVGRKTYSTYMTTKKVEKPFKAQLDALEKMVCSRECFFALIL
jgi:hypothetical protein